MTTLTVRNLPEEVRRGLRLRAARHGHCMEAEVLVILESVIRPESSVKLGSLLAEVGRRAKLSHEEFAVFGQVRDRRPARLVSVE